MAMPVDLRIAVLLASWCQLGGPRSSAWKRPLTWECPWSGRRESNPRSELGKLVFCL